MKKQRILQFTTILLAIIACFCVYYSLFTEKGQRYVAKVRAVEYIPNQNFDITQTLAFAKRDSIYKDFRAQCPFHFQTIGLAAFADSSYLFVLSEPAPYVSSDSVVRCFAKFNIHAEIATHPVGYDGWMKDIVVCVGRATSENISNLTNHLSNYLYQSDYKPVTTPLPLDTSRIYYSPNKLNYRISLAELNQWFIDDQELFMDLTDTSRTFSIPDIFKNRQTGIFYSQLPGFVVWCLDKKSDIAPQTANIRRFALDADLILGAISDSATLAIIGRERESNLMELPPLNVEMILLIASIKDGELSQSLDINDLLAGKMSNNKDWCPTYLSPQLEHTEFGHLLTITDVLLKDWSENGTLQYEDYDYPKPPRFPFDRPLFSKLGLNELVYNWNTANTMFVYDYDGMSLYALNRTGSLPVSYFNSQAGYISAGHGYENTAYNYFSGLCNTDLIRVVQYTSLYQIFQDNKITYSCDSSNAVSLALLREVKTGKPYLLLSQVKKLLTNIKNLDDITLDSISKRVGHSNYEKYAHSQLTKQMDDWERDNKMPLPNGRRDEIVEEVRTNNQKDVRNNLVSLRQQLQAMSETDFTNLCTFLSYPRGNRLSNKTKQQLYGISSKVLKTIFNFGKTNLQELGVDMAGVKNFYSNNLRQSSGRWMKTPSLIVSYNSPRATGGHNLSSRVRRVNSLNADKAIVSSGRPQMVSSEYKPSAGTPPQKSTKPKGKTASVQPPKATKPTSTTPVRSRDEVISSAGRARRGL